MFPSSGDVGKLDARSYFKVGLVGASVAEVSGCLESGRLKLSVVGPKVFLHGKSAKVVAGDWECGGSVIFVCKRLKELEVLIKFP